MPMKLQTINYLSGYSYHPRDHLGSRNPLRWVVDFSNSTCISPYWSTAVVSKTDEKDAFGFYWCRCRRYSNWHFIRYVIWLPQKLEWNHWILVWGLGFCLSLVFCCKGHGVRLSPHAVKSSVHLLFPKSFIPCRFWFGRSADPSQYIPMKIDPDVQS